MCYRKRNCSGGNNNYSNNQQNNKQNAKNNERKPARVQHAPLATYICHVHSDSVERAAVPCRMRGRPQFLTNIQKLFHKFAAQTCAYFKACNRLFAFMRHTMLPQMLRARCKCDVSCGRCQIDLQCFFCGNQ